MFLDQVDSSAGDCREKPQVISETLACIIEQLYRNYKAGSVSLYLHLTEVSPSGYATGRKCGVQVRDQYVCRFTHRIEANASASENFDKYLRIEKKY